MAIVYGSIYQEPTQWCMDVWINDTKYQLSWGPYDRPQPTEEEIRITAEALEAALYPISPYELEGEGGEIV